jgi:prepilin peptidase CpaA
MSFQWALELWPVLFICVAMIACAVIDWWKFKVPNKLTFPLIFGGWLLGLLNLWHLVPYGGEGGLGEAVAGTFLACGLLLPAYAIGGMGAGDVKMTMGFGSWIGAFYGFGSDANPNGMWVIVYAFCAGVIVGGVIGVVMIVLRGNYRQNASHVRNIIGDLFTSSGVTEIASKAHKRRPRWHRLPYGVPLCLGFVGYLVYYYSTVLVP